MAPPHTMTSTWLNPSVWSSGSITNEPALDRDSHLGWPASVQPVSSLSDLHMLAPHTISNSFRCYRIQSEVFFLAYAVILFSFSNRKRVNYRATLWKSEAKVNRIPTTCYLDILKWQKEMMNKLKTVESLWCYRDLISWNGRAKRQRHTLCTTQTIGRYEMHTQIFDTDSSKVKYVHSTRSDGNPLRQKNC